jgi:hypothetical protein
MRTRWSIYFTCLVAILGLSTLAFGGSGDTAVLRSSGPVIVNDGAAPTTTALFRGDKVQTANGGVVTISSPGSTVLIPSNSRMVFNGGVLDLTAGTASISTTKGMAAQADKYLIAPATSGTARFEIKKSGSSVLIHASSGVLNVSTPGNTFTLAEGATATLDSGTGTSKAASHNIAARGVYGAQSTRSFFNLEGALSDPSDPNIPFCPTAVCRVPPSVSGHSPCRCRLIQ